MAQSIFLSGTWWDISPSKVGHLGTFCPKWDIPPRVGQLVSLDRVQCTGADRYIVPSQPLTARGCKGTLYRGPPVQCTLPPGAVRVHCTGGARYNPGGARFDSPDCVSTVI